MGRQSFLRHHTQLFVSFSFVVLSVLFLLGPSRLGADPIYSVQNLSFLNGSAAAVSAINSSGTAVGFITDTQGNQVPVSFGAGASQALSPQAQGQANGINDAGTVIGTSISNNQPSVAEWSNGQMTNLGIAGYGTAINNSGQIAGAYQTATGDLHAFESTPGSPKQDLGTLGGKWSSAYGINSTGQVAGTATLANGDHNAFLFSSGTGMVDLGTLGGANSYGFGINDSGEVVGNSQTQQSVSNAFAWVSGTTGGKMTDLGTLGGSQSYAYGVNDNGAVVGYSWITGNTATHGFVFLNGVMLDLNSLLPLNSGWTIDAAYGVNSVGDIVGTGTYDGQLYAIELDPGNAGSGAVDSSLCVPEPLTIFLVGLGLFAAGYFKVDARSSRKRHAVPRRFLRIPG